MKTEISDRGNSQRKGKGMIADDIGGTMKIKVLTNLGESRPRKMLKEKR